MPIILCSNGIGKGITIINPDKGAKVGRWCAKKTGEKPDRCDKCFDPETLAHYPAEGYREERDPKGNIWLYGTCHRCSLVKSREAGD